MLPGAGHTCGPSLPFPCSGTQTLSLAPVHKATPFWESSKGCTGEAWPMGHVGHVGHKGQGQLEPRSMERRINHSDFGIQVLLG